MKRPIAPVLLIEFCAVMVIIDQVNLGPRLLHFPHDLWGLVPLCSGLVFGLAARQQFIRRGTPLNPFTRPAELVTSGPFQHSRNPMYLSLSSMLLGIALILSSTTCLVLVVVFVIILDRIYIPPEERAMEKHFGQDYSRYRSVTPKWL